MLKKHEIMHAENLLRSFSKASFKDLQTTEVFALRDAIYWLDSVVKETKEAEKKQPAIEQKEAPEAPEKGKKK